MSSVPFEWKYKEKPLDRSGGAARVHCHWARDFLKAPQPSVSLSRALHDACAWPRHPRIITKWPGLQETEGKKSVVI